MSAKPVELEGTLRPDGTVVLDRRPNVPPGRVKVVLQPTSELVGQPEESLVDFVKRIRRESEARGHRFMSDEEVTAWVEELRADDDRIERAYREGQAE